MRQAVRGSVRNAVIAVIAVLIFRPLCFGEVISGKSAQDGKNWNLIMNFREGASTNTVTSDTNTLTAQLNNGTAWVSNRNGAGNAVNFDGTNDDITLALPSEGLFDFQVTSTFAVIVVLSMPTADISNHPLVSKWTSSTLQGWQVLEGDASDGVKMISFNMRTDDTNYHNWKCSSIDPTIFNNTRWHTASFIYRGIITGTAGKELYFDGVSYSIVDDATAGTVSNIQNDIMLRIGATNDASGAEFKGSVGAVLVSRDGYAPDAQGMKDMHKRLMGIVARQTQ